MIKNKEVPVKYYNYSYIKDILEKNMDRSYPCLPSSTRPREIMFTF
ncbi:MAG: hypothetical protein PHW73_09710 [Atribacterota bacterium]|nr:hypothetical protein [Atribacterota bacterium]